MTDDRDNETGSTDETGSARPVFKLVDVPFGPYTVTLRLSPTDRFLDIAAVCVAKDFRSTTERNKGVGFHDVSDLYEGKET